MRWMLPSLMSVLLAGAACTGPQDVQPSPTPESSTPLATPSEVPFDGQYRSRVGAMRFSTDGQGTQFALAGNTPEREFVFIQFDVADELSGVTVSIQSSSRDDYACSEAQADAGSGARDVLKCDEIELDGRTWRRLIVREADESVSVDVIAAVAGIQYSVVMHTAHSAAGPAKESAGALLRSLRVG